MQGSYSFEVFSDAQANKIDLKKLNGQLSKPIVNVLQQKMDFTQIKEDFKNILQET